MAWPRLITKRIVADITSRPEWALIFFCLWNIHKDRNKCEHLSAGNAPGDSKVSNHPYESSMMDKEEGNNTPTAFLVDLVSNRKIPVATPRCRVGRDDLNDIVISGDQSISRFHFIISYENDEFTVQDAKSRHGTFLNGNQITTPETIKDGDVLKVGVSLFWFVVEAVQANGTEPVSPPTVSAIGNERSDGVGITVKSQGHSEHSAMTETAVNIKALDPNSKLATQEMTKPDPAVMAKLEEAANAIQIPPKADPPKASLASLLQPLATEVVQSNEDAVKAKLAAQDKELLEDLDSADATEVSAVEKDDAEADADADINNGLKVAPPKVLNKPSDTVTLEALQPTGLASSLERDGEPLASEASDLSSSDAKSDSDAGIIDDAESEKTSFAPGDDDSDAAPGGLRDLLARQDEPLEEKAEEQPAEKASDNLEVNASTAADEAESSPAVMPAEEAEAVSAEAETTPEPAAPEVAAEAEPQADEISPRAEEAEPASEVQTSSNSKETNGSASSAGNGSGSASNYADSMAVNSLILDEAMTIRAGATNVPDWTKRYFSDEIAKLNGELDELNEQVKLAQQKIRDVETRVALTKGMRNTLLTTTGDELVEACGKVLSLIGWKTTIAADDKHELRLEVDDKQVCIARVIWTTTQAERSHLGQLSISQTRYWCEKGTEPKGILIVSKISDHPPSSAGATAEEAELADYAAKKNVCLMTTMQLLSLYKEVALSDAKPDALRSAIISANGWLAGHDLEPGNADVEKEDSSGQASNKLSSLLSA
jgi:hypothetical protein